MAQLLLKLQYGRRSLPALELFGLLTAVLVAVGSTRPWVCIWGEGFSQDGIEVACVNGITADGRVTVALGILAAAFISWRLLRRRSSTLNTIVLCTTIVILVIAGLVGVFNWSELREIPDGDQGANYFRYGFRIGWGLILVTVASLTGAGALVYLIWRDYFR